MALPPAQKHLFYTELAKLLEAGFGIRDAAAVMLDTRLPEQQAALLSEMESGLDAGQTITEAFSRNGGRVSSLEKSIIGAGERGGRLAPAFQHLADYYGLLAESRRQAIQGTVYPVFLIHLGIIAGIVPAALFQEKSMGEILIQTGIAFAIFYVVALVLFLGVRSLLKAALENPAVDSLLNRIPMVGRARRSMAMARFTKVYHTCVLAGLSISESARSASVAAQSGTIRQVGERLAATAEEGGKLGPIFTASDAFPKAFARSYATAEESGGLDKDLARWSTVYQEDARNSAKALSVAIPKLIYFLVMIFVAWQIISAYGLHIQQIKDLDE